jgi:NADH-quinone oxidoreductase subunit J
VEITGAQAAIFYVLAVFTLLMAFSLITAPTAVRGALFLMGTLVGVAGLFLLLHAEFVAGAQILIYVGGVVVLFIFVIMLVNVREEITETIRTYTHQMAVAYIVVAVMALGVVFLGVHQLHKPVNERVPILPQQRTAQPAPEPTTAGGRISADTQLVGNTLYVRAALPFEIASVLLLVAIIGSVVLARTRRQEETFD